MLGVDRLDYTKGIRHRLKAYEELLSERRIGPPEVTPAQVATPSGQPGSTPPQPAERRN